MKTCPFFHVEILTFNILFSNSVCEEMLILPRDLTFVTTWFCRNLHQKIYDLFFKLSSFFLKSNVMNYLAITDQSGFFLEWSNTVATKWMDLIRTCGKPTSPECKELDISSSVRKAIGTLKTSKNYCFLLEHASDQSRMDY